MKWLFAGLLASCTAQAFAQNALCEKKLLSYSTFKEQPDQKWHLELKNQRQTVLYYFGAEHSKDSSQQQFADMQKQWQKVKPTIALFEGPDRGTIPAAGETIARLGESGYLRFLAKKDSVPVMSLEPSPVAEVNFLNTIFPAGQVKLFFALREAWQVRERNKMDKEQIYQYISKMLVKANQLPHMQDTITTMPQIEEAFRHYWGDSLEWWQAPAAWFSPQKSSNETGGLFTNDINQQSSEFRNLYMYRLISKLLREGKTVFAVVGRNHVPMQATALTCEWEQIQHPDTKG